MTWYEKTNRYFFVITFRIVAPQEGEAAPPPQASAAIVRPVIELVIPAAVGAAHRTFQALARPQLQASGLRR